MADQFETGGETPDLTPSVAQATKRLSGNEPVTAAALAEAILDRHRRDYARGKGGDLTLEVDSPDHERRPVFEWLRAVRELFDTEREPELHGRAVIIGLSLLDLDLRRQLDENGFLAALKDEYDESLDDVLTDKGHSLEGPADSVPTQPDRPLERREDDQLQRVAFARYLARRIHDISSTNSYSINLYGPWGSGKSTLLNFLEDELTEGQYLAESQQQRESDTESSRGGRNGTTASEVESWQVVRFNAWQHQRVQPPWWALMDHVYQGSKAELSRKDRLSEYWWRLRSGRLRFFVGVILVTWLAAIAIHFLLQGATVTELAQIAEVVSKILAVVVPVWAVAGVVTNSLVGGSASAAQSYVDSAENPMNTIKDRFNHLIGRIPKPVAIFIDDLDRCDCEYVVELLEGVQTLFTDAPVVFVVAADRDWLNTCFGEIYSTQQSVVNSPAKTLGGLFLEKTFQFSTPVPTIPKEMKEEYWRSLLMVKSAGETGDTDESSRSASEVIGAAASEEDILRVVNESQDRTFVEQQSIREEAVTRLAAPEIVERTEHVLGSFAPLLEPNPRAMKRLVNAYSVNRALATLGHVDVGREPLALWTILSLQYPKLSGYLEENPSAVNRVGNEDPPDVDEELARLFADENVVEIVSGKPVTAELDESTVAQCAKIR